MITPNARVTITEDQIQVDAITPGYMIEVRNYLLEPDAASTHRWTDERGRCCLRYYAVARTDVPVQPEDTTDLHRFALDPQRHAGIDAKLELDTARDGLHVMTIQNVDFYFSANGHGYDGWGRKIEEGAS